MGILNNSFTRYLSKKIVALGTSNSINLGASGNIHPLTRISESSVNGNVVIKEGGLIQKSKISGSVTIDKNCKLLGEILLSGPIEIGRNSSINGPNTDLISRIHPIKIGSYCSIARNVSIQEFNHDYRRITSYFIQHNFFKESLDGDTYSNGPIEVGNDVWIGTHCTILSGAKIGNGAVIAANSVVTGEIPDYAIAGGSPAKVLKYRFSEDIIQELQRLEWWKWTDEKLALNKSLFYGDLTMDKLGQIK